jgi:hypothetical protein
MQLFAHHTGAGSDFVQPNNNRFLDPFTGRRESPGNYLIYNYELLKGERENRNVHANTLFVEKILGEGKYAINFSALYIYYEQFDRKDAARYGKPFIGAKYLPFLDLSKNYIFILESRLGFPSGKRTDRFTGGNYYVGNLQFTTGYIYKRFSILGKIIGLFPFWNGGTVTQEDYSGVPYYLRPTPDYFARYLADKVQLKKSTIYSIYANVFIFKHLSVFFGFLYRTPYEGIEKTRATGDRIPLIFRESSIGFTIPFSEKYALTLTYRQPLNRGKEFRLYESAYNLSFMMEF